MEKDSILEAQQGVSKALSLEGPKDVDMVIEGSKEEIKEPMILDPSEKPPKKKGRPPMSSESPTQRKKRFDSQFEALDSSFQNTDSEDFALRVALLSQKQEALKSRLDEVHSQDMKFRKHYYDSNEDLTKWNGELEAKIENFQQIFQTALKTRNEEVQEYVSKQMKVESDRAFKENQDLREKLENRVNAKIVKLDQDLSATLRNEANQRNEDLQRNILNQLQLDEKFNDFLEKVIQAKLKKQNADYEKLFKKVAEGLDAYEKHLETLELEIKTLKKSLNQKQLDQIEEHFAKKDDALWNNIKEMFVGKGEYDALDDFTHQLAKRLETYETKCDAVEKKIASPQIAIELNEKRLDKIDKDILDLRLFRDNRFKELDEKLSPMSTEVKILQGKVLKFNEELLNLNPGERQSSVAYEKFQKEIFEHLEELKNRLIQSEKKIESVKEDLSQRAFTDPKIIKELINDLKLKIQHCLNSVDTLKASDLPHLENRQTIVETALMNQEKPQHNFMIIDAFQQKVNDMINSLQKLREQNAMEKAEAGARLEKIEKVQNTEMEKLRLMVNETTIDFKFSSIEAKIRELSDDYNRELQRISGLVQQQSELSLQINGQTQNLNFLQSQIKSYQTREETNSREWRLAIENLIKNCQKDIKEVQMFLETHHCGIKSLDGQSEELRQEVLLIRSACSNLESALNNVNNDIGILIEAQNKTFLKQIKETTDALQANSERFQYLLTSEVKKIDEKFFRIDDKISNLVRNSFHLSRSFEQEEEHKDLRRISPSLQAEKQNLPSSQPREESRSSHFEGYQGRLSVNLQDSKKKSSLVQNRLSDEIPPSSHGRLSGLNLSQQNKITDEILPIRRERHQSRLVLENPEEEQFGQPRLQDQPSYSQTALPKKTSFLQPPSHQHLFSLLPSSSLNMPSSTLQHSQPLAESRIDRESLESTQKKQIAKKNVVADLFSSKKLKRP